MSDMDTQRRILLLEQQLERLRKVDTPLFTTGTYTPTYTGGTTPGATTYSIQQGAWAGIGNMVIVTGTVVWAAATGTGTATISLPFTAANIANQFASGSVRVDSVTFAAGTPEIVISPGTASFILVSPATNAASTAVTVEAAGNIVFTVIYFV